MNINLFENKVITFNLNLSSVQLRTKDKLAKHRIPKQFFMIVTGDCNHIITRSKILPQKTATKFENLTTDDFLNYS